MVKLRDYYNAYLDYYKMADEIEREQNALHEIEAECSDLDKAISALERDRKNTKEILDDKTKHYSTQSTLLAASERKLCVNKKGINGLASLNEYTNPDIFEQINEELRATCEDKKQAYIADREKTLKAELSSLKRKLEIFEVDKAKTVDRIISGSGNKDKLEEKKADVLDYLNASPRVKTSEESQRIIQLIESPVDSSWYECSESELMDDMLSLDSTDGYLHDGKFDLDDYMRNSEKYTSGIFPLLLFISAIALLVYFMMGHSPLNFMIPSSYSVADASSSVVNTGLSALKVLAAIGVGIIVGGIIELIASIIVGNIVGGIIGIAVAIFAGRFFYSRYSPSIHWSNMMGFGNIVHTIMAFLINLILVLIIIAIVFFAFVSTPLARFVYKINPERLKEDLHHFEKYVNDNRIAYISLFNYPDAVGYAFENRMRSAIACIEKEISSICEEQGYVRIDKEYRQKIKDRCTERTSQIDAIKRKLETYKKGVDEYTKKHISINNMIDVNKKQLANAKKKQTERERVINNMTSQLHADEKYLADQSKEIMGGTEIDGMTDDMFDRECMMRNTSMNLLECNGQLAKLIYFVKKEKDKRGFVELKMIDISCQHTVFIYEHETSMGNNLSEELCNFINWFVEAVRRENPAALLEKFDVIDVVSGRSILTMPPYNRFLNVVSDEKGKQILADDLKKRGEVILGEISAVHIQELGRKVDNVDKLNAVKAEINKPEILQEPNISVRSLLEAFVPYKILLFIVPDVNYDGSQPSILNEDLKRILNNTELYGIVPVFFIAHDTWNDTKRSSDTVYLHSISNKTIHRIKNIGSTNERNLDL